MHISLETTSQSEKRLKEVMRSCAYKIYEGAYVFEEFPLEKYKFNSEALAVVRDEEVCSQLVKAKNQDKELFKIFSFHFKEGLNNSGFVGWLASIIKNKIGSGVFVICGQNSKKGGIFDYWGCPYEVADQVIELIEELRCRKKREK